LVGLFLASLSTPALCDGVPVSAAPATGAGASILSSGDAWFAAASAAGIAVSSLGDRWAWRESQGSEGAQKGIARLAEHLGNPLVVAPALLASYATGRITGLPGLSSSSARVAGAIAGAGLLDLGLKVGVGRARPGRGTCDPDDFRPFGRLDAAFPSGHTTIAFAAAAAIQSETRARWVPWVVYPAASVVGWSRIRENEHWLSDVVAGAALGYWSGRTIDRIERTRFRIFDRASFLVNGSRRSFRLGFRAHF
jgi:membrane-associated phospholipid phosphatase